ncbi:MAG: LysM peptidoglycan-binding domain-containing protein [Alphaproteobacteria bacterium]|nr:LysM peptidoglycan-binding domain-containing protein [Alphaproteobacteria bacterium]
MRYLLIGAAGLVLVAVALAWTFLGGDETSIRGPAPVAGLALPGGPQPPNPPPLGAGAPDAASPAASPQAPAAATPPQSLQRRPPTPSFDVVRIKPNGDAVFAGRAEPGAVVTILDGGQPIGTVTADSRGEWVYLPTVALPAGSRELGLSAKLADGTVAESSAVVVLHVPDRAKPEQVAAAPAALGKVEPAAGPAPAANAPPGGQSASVVAVATPRAGDGPSRVLQSPTAGRPIEPGGVSVDVVDYDDKGELILSGRGSPGSSVVIYLDNKTIGQANVDKDRQWQLRPQTSVDPGTYQMRADQVSPKGSVVARVEMPFMRSDVSNQAAENPGRVIVQPGNSLWRIARHRYGAGPRFTVIYSANKEQIRDPNLIYPGQVFNVPVVN